MFNEQVMKDYMSLISDLKKANEQVNIAIQGLEAITKSGQINIADKTLEAINELKND